MLLFVGEDIKTSSPGEENLVFGVGYGNASTSRFLFDPGVSKTPVLTDFLGVSGKDFLGVDASTDARATASSIVFSSPGDKGQPNSSSLFSSDLAFFFRPVLSRICSSKVLLADEGFLRVAGLLILETGSVLELLMTALFSLSFAASSHRKNLHPSSRGS